MSKKRVIIRNIFSLSAANVMTKILNALAGIVLARYFSLNDYGAYQTAFAYVAMFCVISDLGIGQLIVRDGSRNKEGFEDLSNNALMLEFILSLVTFLLMLVCMLFTSYTSLTILFVVLLSIGQLLIESTFTPVYTSVFQVYDKLDVSAVITILYSVITACMIFIFAYFKFSATMFILIFPITSVIFLIARVVLTKNYYKVRIVCNLKKIKYIIIESIPYGVSSVSSYIYLQSGTVILSLMMAEKYTGLFSAAFKLILITYTIPGVIYISLMNHMFSFDSSNKEIFEKYFNSLLKLLLPIGLFISFNFFYFSKDIIIFLYKLKFEQSIAAFKYLSVLIVLEFINYPPASLLTFTDKQKTKSIIQCVIAVLNIIFNVLFIKMFGMLGVVYAIILTDTLKNMLWYIFAYKYGYKINADKKYFLILGAIILTAIIYNILYGKINFIVLGIIGSFIYVFILLKFKYFDKNEIKYLS